MAKSLIFRRRLAEAIEGLEQEIKIWLSNEGKDEMTSGGLKISIKQDGGIEISELRQPNLEQLKLPLAIEPAALEQDRNDLKN